MIFDTRSHPRTAPLLERATRELSEADPLFRDLIRRIGPCELAIRRRGAYFPALVEAIVYQQLSGKAAARILERFRALFPSRRFPTPDQVARTPDARLRSAGLSPQKISYVKDLARRTADGSFPLRRISAMEDAEVMRRLTEIKGIGPWTAEMFLIFTLGRPDILPVTDLGIRKAVQQLYSMETLPAPSYLIELGRRWEPHRSVAAWYLWASVDGQQEQKNTESPE
jgi:3-methyladenine DNA glycosylase/8-oxoguanine DNA glycosylase